MRRILVLTVVLVLAMGAVAFAAGPGAPPQSEKVAIKIQVDEWVRIWAPGSVTIEFTPGESGGYADFATQVRGNIGYVVSGGIDTDTIWSTDFSMAENQKDLPVPDNGKFPIGSQVRSLKFGYQYAQRELWVRVAAHFLDHKAGTFGAGNLVLTIGALPN